MDRGFRTPMQTPGNRIPGAYMQTPGGAGNDPVQRRLFPRNGLGMPDGGADGAGNLPNGPGGIDGAGGVSALQPLLPQVQALENANALPPVLRASREINRCLERDGGFPDIDSYCRPGGSSDYDLPLVDSAWAPFHRTQMFPIPDSVLDELNRGQVQIAMGLFSEINHAWVTIDNELYLWDYTHPNPELVGFEDQPHTITGIQLVAPKKGVFVDAIKHILVVATTSDILLLGVGDEATAAGGKTISLYSTRMGLSHRGHGTVSLIAGSSTGRIFFGGANDVDIYELYYQQEEKWFSSRCGKINHTHPGWSSVYALPGSDFWGRRDPEHLVDIVVDDSRKLLYTLSSRSTIRTFHMEGPEKLTKVIEKDLTSCLRETSHLLGNASPLLTSETQIVSISPISAYESGRLHLMALTNTGCRLFLSATSSSSYMFGMQSGGIPQSMQVQFVKFPPREVRGQGAQDRRRAQPVGANGALDAPLDMHSRALDTSRRGMRFAPGYFVDVVHKPSIAADRDLIFISAPESGKIKHGSSALNLRYHEHGNWIEIDSQAEAIGLISKPFSAARHPVGFGNELAVQFDEPSAEIAIMTNTGIHVIRRKRLVDIFAAAIRGTVGDEGLESETRKFIQLYGRVETISAALAVACGQGSDPRAIGGRAVDQATQDRAKAVFVDYGGQPTSPASGNVTAEVKLSSRHDALVVYLTRLVRSLWRARVVDLKDEKDIKSTVPSRKLVTIQEGLDKLRNFLQQNKGIIQGLSGPSDVLRPAAGQDETAVQMEHQSLHAIQKLMESISEGISFVLTLFDERVTDIYNRLDDTSRRDLRDLTYERLFSQQPGKDLAKVLVKAIVYRNIESGSNVETVADSLRRRCGSFCSPDDVVIFKAQEQLQRASEQTQNTSNMRVLLRESLQLFERVAGSLTQANLNSAVQHYLDLQYYAGPIELCLVVAREKDRGNRALSWVNDGRPANDPRKAAFDERKLCYDQIHMILERLDAAMASEPDMLDGRPTLAATKRMEAHNVVNESDDEVFHVDLYEWYIQQGWTERILSMESPHVLTFLRRLASTDPQPAELLCSFYTQRGRFFEAAEVQADLAKSEFDISIKDRITLLSRAKANASVTTTGVGRQQQQMLIHEVTELLDIAHIQDDLLGRLQADSRIPADRKVQIQQALDGPVQNLTELFNNYADQAGYFDLCLLIYNAADYQNGQVISDTWRSLVERVHQECAEQEQQWRAQGEHAYEDSEAPPRPYEAVSLQVQNMAHRTSLDSLIFPIDNLLEQICEYAVENEQDTRIGADPSWPILLFLSLGVSHSIVVRVLERILDLRREPFYRRRVRVVEWITCSINLWLREVERRGGSAGGRGDVNGLSSEWVRALLARSLEELPAGQGLDNTNPGGAPVAEIRLLLEEDLRAVEHVASAARNSFRFV